MNNFSLVWVHRFKFNHPLGANNLSGKSVCKLFQSLLPSGSVIFSIDYYLYIVTFVFINNTIRLAINARRREIAIMRLVGASNSFIRGPFLMEGVLEAVIGALLAIAVLVVGAHMLLPVMAESMTFLTFAIPTMVMLGMSGLLLLLGLLLGLFGSAIAMGRYLKA